MQPLSPSSGLFTAIVMAAGLVGSCVLPANAQVHSLQSGDNVTIDAAGTHGIYQGKPINNATTLYTGNGNGDGDALYLNTGSTFTLGAGATIDGPACGVKMDGGSATINGGTLFGGSDGGIGMRVDGGTAIVNNGSFSGNFSAILTSPGTFTQINGGSFTSHADGLAAFGGTVVVTGGAFTGGPGGPATLVAAGGCVLDLFGTFTGFGNGSIITDGTGTISGTLLDGEAINDTYYINNTDPSTRIEFNVVNPAAPVPEASTTVSFGLLLALGLGGVVIAAWKRKAATSA